MIVTRGSSRTTALSSATDREMLLGGVKGAQAPKFTPNGPSLRRHLRDTAAAVTNVLLDACVTEGSALGMSGSTSPSLDVDSDEAAPAATRTKRKRRRF